MKILLVNKFHYRRGGSERAYLDTGRILESHGHTVAYFSMQHPNNIETPWKKYFIKNREYNRDHYSVWKKISLALDILWNCEARKNFAKLLDDFQPDVIHLHNISHQISPSILSLIQKRRIPAVMTLHDYKLISPNYFLFLRGRVWEGGGWQCLRDRCVRDSYGASAVCAVEFWMQHLFHFYDAVDFFLSPSEFLKQKFETSGFPGEIRRISQPIDQTNEKENTGAENFFLYAGRLSYEKGVETLLQSVAKIPNALLHIAGEGPDRELLGVLARELGIERSVRFLGHLSSQELEVQIRKAKAVIVSSLWHENMPYAVVEALALGKIVVASRMGGITERIKDGKNGFLFPAGNDETLAEILKNLETQNLSDIAQRARESVRDLNEDAYYTQLMDVYISAGKKKNVGI